MIRRQVYAALGGFNGKLLTREEKDLCDRIREAGHAIVRLDVLMARHNAGLLRFGQWWQRAVWGGYGDALLIATQKKDIGREQLHRIRRYLTWPIAVPLCAIVGVTGMWWSAWWALVTITCFIAYGLLFARIASGRLRKGNSIYEAMVYAFFLILRKFASGYGFVSYLFRRGKHSKRPDPHAI